MTAHIRTLRYSNRKLILVWDKKIAKKILLYVIRKRLSKERKKRMKRKMGRLKQKS